MQNVVFWIYTFLLLAALFPVGALVALLQHLIAQNQKLFSPDKSNSSEQEKKPLGCGCIMMIIGVVPFFIFMVGLGICTHL